MSEVGNVARRRFLFGRSPSSGQAADAPAVTQRSHTSSAPETPPNAVRFGEDCLARQQVVCRTCAEMCDVGAIRFVLHAGKVAQPELVADRCTACGDCVADCPTLAIQLCYLEKKEE